MAVALLYADRINAVLAHLCQEIPHTGLTAKGLEWLALELPEAASCGAILNGIDTKDWDQPQRQQTNPAPARFSASNPRPGRATGDLQERMGLSANPAAFLWGCPTRLVDQKGVDLLLQVGGARTWLHRTARSSCLATGDRRLRKRACGRWPRATQGRFSRLLTYDACCAADLRGADVFLMPQEEPTLNTGGISQLFGDALRLHSRWSRKSGLVDTVTSTLPPGTAAPAFCFDRYEPNRFLHRDCAGWNAGGIPKLQDAAASGPWPSNSAWQAFRPAYDALYKDVRGVKEKQPVSGRRFEGLSRGQSDESESAGQALRQTKPAQPGPRWPSWLRRGPG